MTATPTAAPICRDIANTPDAAPANRASADAIARREIGAPISPIPIPRTTITATMSP